MGGPDASYVSAKGSIKTKELYAMFLFFKIKASELEKNVILFIPLETVNYES